MSDAAVPTPSGSLKVVGVILAGGRARRMEGLDKPLIPLAGQPLIERAVLRLAPQVASIVISANGAPDRFEPYGHAIVADRVPGFAGPLAGMLAGLEWAREHAPGTSHVATVAVDTPFFPLDLVARLLTAAGPGDAAVAASNGRLHPVFALVPIAAAGVLAADLAGGRSLSVGEWLGRLGATPVNFDSAAGNVDPFFNVNTPADLAEAAALAARCARP